MLCGRILSDAERQATLTGQEGRTRKTKVSIGRLSFLFVGGLALGLGWLIALEPLFFTDAFVPTPLVVVRVEERFGSMTIPRLTGRAPDGSEVRFECETGGKVGQVKTVSVARGLFTGRRFASGACWSTAING